jgi:hypothetical protein
MRTKYMLLFGLVAYYQLAAQSPTVTQTNNSNPGASPNMKIGDSFTVTVTGPAGQQVTTVSPSGNFVDGNTNGSGVWTGNGTGANVGNWSVVYSVGGVAATPNPLTFQVDGPAKMTVTSDVSGHCSGCRTTVARFVTYQVYNLSGSTVSNLPICENIQLSSWTCSQSQPTASVNTCFVNNGVTTAGGSFTDQWTLNSDSWTPVGCGFGSIHDTWQYPYHQSSPTIIVPFGTLNGSSFTNSTTINGCTTPGSCSLVGTTIFP